MSIEEKYEAVIGLEVHAQLQTKSKLFCLCRNEYGGDPNTHICPVCTGQPGSLPVVNKQAIELGIRAAIALHCQIHERSVFSRKNYFYPDLPKGYQISQFERPYCTGGHINIELEDGLSKKISLTRIHFEEDAGKSVHSGSSTLVNLNRAGVPLCEIVSEPQLSSPHEAGQYLRKLRTILRYAQVCDGNMEEGSFRCDANVSIRPRGQSELGTKVELKNINSFRFIEKAIEYEIHRQAQALDDGETIVQQTRSWNTEKKISEVMREKEQANDYRYFPEPDLPVLEIAEKWQTQVREQMPELPDEKQSRFVQTYGLSVNDASSLIAKADVAEFFEQVARLSNSPKLSANWILNELTGRLNASSKSIAQSPVNAGQLAALIRELESERLSGKMAKEAFGEMFDSGKELADIIKDRGLVQLSDPKSLMPMVQDVVNQHPEQVQQYREGKTKLLGFFVGKVMKATKGQANPKTLNDLVKQVLDQS